MGRGNLAFVAEDLAAIATMMLKIKFKNERVYFELLDLASLTSVRDFADRIKVKCKRLDILINNAGQFMF
jgi:NAD(P)-dependent dehydrogenase (short-subunit alcohol dehydrogenase family)